MDQLLAGLLQGLTRGLLQAQGGQGPPCPSDPQAYQQYQQQYQQQMQQYQFQLQQYQMQQQQQMMYAQFYGTNPYMFGMTGQPQPTQPVPCTQSAQTSPSPQSTPTLPLPLVGSTPSPSTPATSTPAALVGIVANPGTIPSGGISILSWSSIGTSRCFLFDDAGSLVGSGFSSGSATSSRLAKTTGFAVSCSTISGSATTTASTTVTVRP